MKTILTQILAWIVFIITANAQNKIQVAAHRGDWRNAPENSIKAFLSAVSMGVDIVELDLKASKEKEIIILHDRSLNRSTTGKGAPGDFSIAELKEFRLRDGLGVPTRNQIPTLKEAILALKSKPVKVNLDHAFPYFREAYEILEETGTLNQAIFKSSEPFDTLKAHYPELIEKITYMPVVDLDEVDAKSSIDAYLANMKCWAFELVFGKDTSPTVLDNQYIRKTGAKVWINSLWPNLNGGHFDDLAIEDGNTKDSWEWLIAHGATVIQTDRPKELIAFLRAKGWHK